MNDDYGPLYFYLQDYEKTDPGGNVIGILPGSKWGTQSDRPVVVGAHWDTVC